MQPTSPILGYQLAELTARYQPVQFIHLPQLISPERAGQLLATTRGIPVKRVNCGDRTILFGEQTVASNHPVSQFFATELAPLALALTGCTQVTRMTCWTSVYGPGESINPHTDVEGSVHILVCLQATSADTNGGHLILRPNTPGQIALELAPGDGVAFNATAVRHCTTPLIATSKDADPSRVVAVGRYFTS